MLRAACSAHAALVLPIIRLYIMLYYACTVQYIPARMHRLLQLCNCQPAGDSTGDDCRIQWPRLLRHQPSSECHFAVKLFLAKLCTGGCLLALHACQDLAYAVAKTYCCCQDVLLLTVLLLSRRTAATTCCQDVLLCWSPMT